MNNVNNAFVISVLKELADYFTAELSKAQELDQQCYFEDLMVDIDTSLNYLMSKE
jgi:hypothetical protein